MLILAPLPVNALLVTETVPLNIGFKTERDFASDSEASVRYFNGDNTRKLLIDDCIEITKVEVGNDVYGDSFSELSESDYKLLPNNHNSKGLPITSVWYRNGIFGEGIQNQKITAKWGYSEEAPDDIIYVATFLATSVYNTGQGGSLGGIKSERIGEYSVTFSTDSELKDFKKIEKILENYKRYYL